MFIDKTGSLLKMNCLLIINGITNIVESIMLIKNKKISYDLEIIFGILLTLWIII